MTIPGEGKDRIFKVSIKWMAIVSWRMLHEALVSGQIPVPLESVQALDVAMRHLASMRYLHLGGVEVGAGGGRTLLRPSGAPNVLGRGCAGGAGCPWQAVVAGKALQGLWGGCIVGVVVGEINGDVQQGQRGKRWLPWAGGASWSVPVV